MGKVSYSGYKADSPDKNQNFNLIPSNRITMKGVNKSLLLIPIGEQIGNPVLADPGNFDYIFPKHHSVLEIPVPKNSTMSYTRMEHGGPHLGQIYDRLGELHSIDSYVPWAQHRGGMGGGHAGGMSGGMGSGHPMEGHPGMGMHHPGVFRVGLPIGIGYWGSHCPCGRTKTGKCKKCKKYQYGGQEYSPEKTASMPTSQILGLEYNTEDIPELEGLSVGDYLTAYGYIDRLKNNKGRIYFTEFSPEEQEEMYKGGGQLSANKAREILRDGTAQGHPLTAKQKRFFGWVAGGRKKYGGNTDNMSYNNFKGRKGPFPQIQTEQEFFSPVYWNIDSPYSNTGSFKFGGFPTFPVFPQQATRSEAADYGRPNWPYYFAQMGGPMAQASQDSVASAPVPDYYDTDIFKTPIKAHIPAPPQSGAGYKWPSVPGVYGTNFTPKTNTVWPPMYSTPLSAPPMAYGGQMMYDSDGRPSGTTPAGYTFIHSGKIEKKAYGGEEHCPECEAEMMKKGGWIRAAAASIKRRGTKGVCTGARFGSSSCPPGSRRYNLAKVFKKIARKRRKQEGGQADFNEGQDYFTNEQNDFLDYLQNTAFGASVDDLIDADYEQEMHMGGFVPYGLGYFPANMDWSRPKVKYRGFEGATFNMPGYSQSQQGPTPNMAAPQNFAQMLHDAGVTRYKQRNSWLTGLPTKYKLDYNYWQSEAPPEQNIYGPGYKEYDYSNQRSGSGFHMNLPKHVGRTIAKPFKKAGEGIGEFVRSNFLMNIPAWKRRRFPGYFRDNTSVSDEPYQYGGYYAQDGAQLVDLTPAPGVADMWTLPQMPAQAQQQYDILNQQANPITMDPGQMRGSAYGRDISGRMKVKAPRLGLAGEDLANVGIAGMDMLTGILNAADAKRKEKELRRKFKAENIFTAQQDRDRGDYTVNQGYFRPDQQTPVQFTGNPGFGAYKGGGYYEVGGEYEMTDEEIKRLESQGYKLEY